MENKKESYREVVKATSLFGGVKVFAILIAVIRSKVIAILIGAEGMGIASLFMSTLNMVNGVTNLGMDKSAVKDISYAREKKDETGIQKAIAILSRVTWITGIVGTGLIMLTSPWLSELAFGNREYTLLFVWVAISLLFIQLTNAKLAILQGIRRHRALAKANLLGNFLGLVGTLPLYYFYGIDAIVPAIILATFLSLAVTHYFSLKNKIKIDSIGNKAAFTQGKSMIRLGIMLSISGLMSLLAAYILQIYISAKGGVDQVGFYNAGFVILNTYVGLIFSAMATDYFPRLSGIIDDLKKIQQTVFEQAHVALLLISPIIVVFIAFAPQIIRILYSGEFDPAIVFVSWAIMGMFFKAVSFSVGYIIIAKGDSNLFLKTTFSFNTLLLTLNILGYTYYGLLGLGISFLVYYIVHFIAIQIITYFRYRFYLKKDFYWVFIVCLFICTGAFLASFLETVLWKYTLLVLLILISMAYSFFQLNKKMDVMELIKSRFKKK
ncbi:O-antigen translocase [Aureisphaera galaxeae]|uniref:O-antigen translocase n=1 Tax=Aureisphaera galaxeae TaxID=1538023 RepID=UPI00234FFD37|nr:O-antigen translocase [Aureisphaera galaxeae]MDC8004459.1 O-antigen translocase [Aureisphaera galaxeae]